MSSLKGNEDMALKDRFSALYQKWKRTTDRAGLTQEMPRRAKSLCTKVRDF
jgi:hypothetical protein